MGTNFPQYLNATAHAVGDFNRDGRPDVAIVGYNLAIYLAQTNGGFMPPTYYSGSGESTIRPSRRRTSMVTPAAILFSPRGPPQTPLSAFSNPDGTFAPPTGYPGGRNGLDWHYCVAAADLDNNGKLDLITGNVEDLSLTISLNNGDGTFGRKTGCAFQMSQIHLTIVLTLTSTATAFPTSSSAPR